MLCRQLESLAAKYELHAAFFAPNNDDSISSETFRYHWRWDTVVGANCVPRLSLGLKFHDVEITAVLAGKYEHHTAFTCQVMMIAYHPRQLDNIGEGILK